MVDHGQTVVISLPTIVHHGWKPCLPFNHGVTMVAHALSILSPGKIVAQTSQGLFNSKYERKHEMDSGNTSSKMTPSCKWPILSLPIASEIEVGFKACLYFLYLFGCCHNDQNLKPF